MKAIILALTCFIVLTGALKCYDGSTTLGSLPPVKECDEKSVTCLKTENRATKLATRSCSAAQCTVNTKLHKDGICVNVSSVETRCCCYKDACN